VRINNNKAIHNRILSPLRIISPGRNGRNEPITVNANNHGNNPNLKAAANTNSNTNTISREMRRVTSAKQLEVNVKPSTNFGGTM